MSATGPLLAAALAGLRRAGLLDGPPSGAWGVEASAAARAWAAGMGVALADPTGATLTEDEARLVAGMGDEQC
jgi:hypothetical protein